VHSLLERDFPFWPLPFDSTNQTLSDSTNVHVINQTTTVDDDGLSTRTFERFDGILRCFPPDCVDTLDLLRFELQPDSIGILTLTRTAGTHGEVLGSFDSHLLLPLLLYDTSGMVHDTLTAEIFKTINHAIITDSLGEEEFVMYGDAFIVFDGLQIAGLSYFVDPPCGCGCGSDSCSCGRVPPEEKAGVPKIVQKGAQGTAVGLCAYGAWLTSPTGVGVVLFALGSWAVVEIWGEVPTD
jgi:hypothetical protein